MGTGFAWLMVQAEEATSLDDQPSVVVKRFPLLRE
jgi:hypothetical protein